MKKMVLPLLLALFFVSCSQQSFYQIYDVESSINKTDNCFFYEDENCRVDYSLWEAGGDLNFVFTNKSDKDMYIYLQNSFMIKNGEAFNHYTGAVYTSNHVEAVKKSVFASGSFSSVGAAAASSVSFQKTTHQEPVIVIPPHSCKTINGCKVISSEVIYSCDRDVDFPSKKADVVERKYNRDNSPIRFVNRIAYSFDKDAKEYEYVDNDFWVSGYFNCRYKTAVKKSKYKDCLSGAENIKSVNVYSSGKRFYNEYDNVHYVGNYGKF